MKAWNFLFVAMIGMISGSGLAQKTFGIGQTGTEKFMAIGNHMNAALSSSPGRSNRQAFGQLGSWARGMFAVKRPVQ